MHDIRLIRDDPEGFDAILARRGIDPVSAQILALDEERRALTTKLQEMQSRRNEASKAIGMAMGQGDKDKAESLKAEVAELKQTMPALEESERELGAKLQDALARIPNLPFDDVPQGAGEEQNVEIAVWGEKPSFDFEPKEHADFAPDLGMDFETGALLSGARFTFLRGDMARLHRALGQFMIDRQTREYGYTECMPPVLVKDEAMYGTDKLPKFAEDSFAVINRYKALSIQLDAAEELTEQLSQEYDALLTAVGDLMLWKLDNDLSHRVSKEFSIAFDKVFELGKVIEAKGEGLPEKYDELLKEEKELRKRGQDSSLWLIPTSEVSLTASVMGQILEESALPIRLTALTQCFRSEAGSAGRDTRGFIRQHQFEKCELVSIVKPEDSEAEHERMTRAAEEVLEALGLPYRKMLLCTGDMGFGARKTYDLEVWLPGQGAYREISSCSNTGDFQARRMKTRYKVAGEKKRNEFVHTLNGSGLAVGRTLVAVIENYQQADGSVLVPEVLHPYMGGVTKLEPQ
ncbi:serine--tRNA ligase [Erythrobacter longus]|uniref:Serine--tRNA ligase n=1 Tax=Erythrobacter longus TaxID=1044 RepID=A0A074M9Z3_ERYLO|nr:serine--tRNA ligase [Erythrobacter longus]KEO90244.1 serine--tRNA ligase [Erythrobacter longus]